MVAVLGIQITELLLDAFVRLLNPTYQQQCEVDPPTNQNRLIFFSSALSQGT